MTVKFENVNPTTQELQMDRQKNLDIIEQVINKIDKYIHMSIDKGKRDILIGILYVFYTSILICRERKKEREREREREREKG